MEDIARKRGITRAEAARQAIAETAERERRRSGLAAEVARLAADPADRAARGDVYRVRLPSRRGREQRGARYAVVVQVDEAFSLLLALR